MPSLRLTLCLLATLTLSACGDTSDSDANATVDVDAEAPAETAAEADVTTEALDDADVSTAGFVDTCLEQPNANRRACECLDEYIDDNYSPNVKEALHASWLPEDDAFRQEVEQRDSFMEGLMTIINEGEAMMAECGGMPSM